MDVITPLVITWLPFLGTAFAMLSVAGANQRAAEGEGEGQNPAWQLPSSLVEHLSFPLSTLHSSIS